MFLTKSRTLHKIVGPSYSVTSKIPNDARYYFKSCPKCGGDLILLEDNFGKYQDCMQCGYIIDTNIPSKEKTEDAPC